MKRVFTYAVIALAALTTVVSSCQKQAPESQEQNQHASYGLLSLSIKTSAPITKAVTSYSETLAAEKAEKTVEVFVFDESSKRLEAYKKINNTSDPCQFKLVSGPKIVYAVLNAKGLTSVKTEGELLAVVDDMSKTTLSVNGLVMIGKTTGTVVTGVPLTASVTVSRLASRVTLQRITNNLPSMYGQITIDAVFLGNANTVSTLGGTPSVMVNKDGFADAGKQQPIGQKSIQGLCANYLYKDLNTDVSVGASNTDKHIFYCMPNASEVYTRLYIVATLNGYTGYYPVELNKVLRANTAYTVEVTLNNPPVERPDQKFEIGTMDVKITIADWNVGDNYEIDL